jgi:hypothetical protein
MGVARVAGICCLALRIVFHYDYRIGFVWSRLFLVGTVACPPSRKREFEWTSSPVAAYSLRYNPRPLASCTQDRTLFTFDIVD